MLDEIISVVRKSGYIIRLADDAEREVTSKEGHANFVTKYDTAVQNFLQEELKKVLPEAAFIGEEGDHKETLAGGWAFIVDPIDGTTNFIKKYNKSCVSVALAKAGEVVLGVVYNPFSNEMFYAEKGKGAFLNDKPIHAARGGLKDELVCMGTSPYYAELRDQTFELAIYLQEHSLDIRRSGSAAQDLCDVAAGRAGLFYELRLSPWDYAAGSLIVTEAGGKVSRIDGSPLSFADGGSVLAGGSSVYDDFFALDDNPALTKGKETGYTN